MSMQGNYQWAWRLVSAQNTKNSFLLFEIFRSGQKEKPPEASRGSPKADGPRWFAKEGAGLQPCLPGGQTQTGESGLLRPEGSGSYWDGVGRRKALSPRPPALSGGLPTDASREVT